jgi:hypothetical protein
VCPVGHRDRSSLLHNLANELSTRFDHRGNAEDLNESRENLCCALTLLTQHDPRRSMIHESLASVYLSFHSSRLDGTGSGEDTDSLNAAMHHFKAAANFVPGGLLRRLQASLSWVRHADQHRHATELDANATSMQLMDVYMSAAASVSSRHSAMKDFPSTLAVDAASCALRSGDVRRAVEWLEQGRTIIWTQSHCKMCIPRVYSLDCHKELHCEYWHNGLRVSPARGIHTGYSESYLLARLGDHDNR